MEERGRGWLIAGLIVTGVCLLWMGFRIDRLGHWEARVLAFALPAVPAAIAIGLVRTLPGSLRRLGIALSLGAALVAELAIVPALVPRDPYASATIDRDRGAATIAVPDGATRFVVSVHGAFAGGGTASWSYQLDLSRGAEVTRVSGALSREIRRGRRSRFTGPSSTLVVHETDSHELTVPGDGALRVAITSESGDAPPRITVAVARPPWGEMAWPIALAAATLLAAIVDGAAMRRGTRLQLSTGMGATAVFAIMVASYMNPQAELRSVVGACLAGALGGSLGGWVLGAIARTINHVDRGAERAG